MISLFEEIDHRLLAALARMLELDPALAKEDALARLGRVADESGMPGAKLRLRVLAERLVRRGVLNPLWLAREGLRPYFFLANGRPGFLEQLVRHSEEQRAGVSHYLIYGDWDAFVLLHGTEAEASQLHTSLQMGAYDEPTQFTAERALVAYRHVVRDLPDQEVALSTDLANALARDFDLEGRGETRDRLLASGYVLGPTWSIEGQQPYPVVAFVGLSLRGRSNVRPEDVRDSLMRDEALRQSLVHLFQVRQGRPFHYLVKLCCLSMTELDEATNAIGFTSLGNVRFDGATLVVASGTDQLPMFRRADVASLPPGPDLTSMVRVGEKVFSRLPADQQQAFNLLDPGRQIAVVRSLAEIGDRIDAARLNASTRERLNSALSTFSRECIVNVGRPNLTGAAAEVTATVEGELKRLLSRLAYATYGKDPARIQKELKLPTRAVRNLALGKVVQALRTAREHDDFRDCAELFDDLWLDRVDRFVEARNRWAHDAVAADIDGLQLIDEAHRTIVEAVEISDWIEARLVAVSSSTRPPAVGAEPEDAGALDVARCPPGRDLSVFISHATADRDTAERIAMGLKAFGHRSWYTEWEMQPGDSILARMETALAQSDTLLVLLSARSVASRWVRRELNTALMAQLSGHDVQVIPVIVEDCEVPELLKGIVHVDLRTDFEKGLITLLAAVRRRRRG